MTADSKGMDPSPPVDRRALLRAAVAVAGTAAVGGAIAAAAANSSSPGVAGATVTPRAGSSGRRTKSVRGAQKSENTSRPDGPASTDGRSPTNEPSEPTAPADQPDNHDRDEPHDANGGDDRSDSSEGDGSTDHSDGNGSDDDHEDDGSTGNHGGPPAIVDTAAVPVGGGVVIAPYRVVVTQPVEGTFRCFGSRCTHAGCTVDDVEAGVIHCPCHGSLFDADTGVPVAGPALEPLNAVAITVKDGGVFLG